MLYTRTADFACVVRALARDYDLYGPARRGDTLALQRLGIGAGDPPEIPWNGARLRESLKPLWFQSGKVVSRWGPDGPAPGPQVRPRAILGAKACDLHALEIIDRVFRDHENPEPFWTQAREDHLVIAGDCTEPLDSCFCTMLGRAPHAQAGFDLNLSPVDGGYLVEIGSRKGEALVHEHAERFHEAATEHVRARDRARDEVKTSVRVQNEPFQVTEPFEKSVDKHRTSQLWDQLAAACVQCNACNMACPTCHCFLLLDTPTDDGSVRTSCWDSCFESGYARMAGGGTPRLQLVERFKNHYHHKFVSFPRNWGVTACSGCGRCIDACMGRIDKRRCLHRLEAEWLPSAAHEGVR